jgi:hypothetical protein
MSDADKPTKAVVTTDDDITAELFVSGRLGTARAWLSTLALVAIAVILAADRQVDSPEPGTVRRITFRDQHQGGLGKLGHLIALRNSDAGLHGVAQVLPSKVEDFDAMFEAGIDGMSMEFHPVGRPQLDPAGTRWRTRIHIEAVALEAEPAYAASRILAVRAAADIEAEEAQAEAQRKAKFDELDAWLAEQREIQARLTS